MAQPYVSAIIAGAGLGKRMHTRVRKPLLTIAGRPILLYTLRNLVRVKSIREIILVVNHADVQLIQKELGQDLTRLRVSNVIPGGSQRFDSVKQGLKCISDDADLVLLHAAVRPFTPPELIHKVIAKAQSTGAAILATPVVDTLKQVRRSRITGTLDRTALWQAQTPQVFRRDIIQAAYAGKHLAGTSDDAQLVERTGRPVVVVPGSPRNFKITTPEDLDLARAMLSLRS